MYTPIHLAIRRAISAIVKRAGAIGIFHAPIIAKNYFWYDRVDDVQEIRLGEYSEVSAELLLSKLEESGPRLAELSELDALLHTFWVGMLDRTEIEPPRHIGLWSLLNTYLERLPDARLSVDDDAIEGVALEYEKALVPPYTVTTKLLLTHFDAPETFAITRDIVFRRVVQDDFVVLARDFASNEDVGEKLNLGIGDWICTITQLSSEPTIQIPRVLIDRLVNALSFASVGRAEVRLAGTRLNSRYLHCGTIRNDVHIRTSSFGTAITLDSIGVAEFKHNFAALTQVESQPSLAYLSVPLRRLRSSAARPDPVDMLVDYVVGLESLLASDTETLEVTFRFRLRGAAVLTQVGMLETPQERLKLLSDIYRARSRAVHGRNVRDLVRLTEQAEAVLKSVFLWFVGHSLASQGADRIVEALDLAMVNTAISASCGS